MTDNQKLKDQRNQERVILNNLRGVKFHYMMTRIEDRTRATYLAFLDGLVSKDTLQEKLE